MLMLLHLKPCLWLTVISVNEFKIRWKECQHPQGAWMNGIKLIFKYFFKKDIPYTIKTLKQSVSCFLSVHYKPLFYVLLGIQKTIIIILSKIKN